jgi:hypothetical protein
VEHIHTDKDGREGKTFGNINPPDANSTLLQNLSGDASKNDNAAAALIISDIIMTECLETDKLAQVALSVKHSLFTSG